MLPQIRPTSDEDEGAGRQARQAGPTDPTPAATPVVCVMTSLYIGVALSGYAAFGNSVSGKEGGASR